MFGMGGTEILVILIVALLFLGPDKLPEAAKQISKGIRDIKKQSRALQRTIEDDENIGGAIRDLRSALRGEDEPIRPKPSKPKEIEAPTPDAVPAIGAVAAAAIAGAPADPNAEAAQADANTEAAPADPNAAAAAIDAADAAAAFAGIGDTTGASFEGDPAHLASSATAASTTAAPTIAASTGPTASTGSAASAGPAASTGAAAPSSPAASTGPAASTSPAANGARAKLTLPPTAGEADDGAGTHDAATDLASLVKPAPNTIARGSSSSGSSSSGSPSSGSSSSGSPSTGASDPSEPKHG